MYDKDAQLKIIPITGLLEGNAAMATNATTWFYKAPETGRPYLISERVTHTFWANRLTGISFTCTQAESPYKVEGQWGKVNVELEWEVGKHFVLRSDKAADELVVVCSEVLGFRPAVSYVDGNGASITEWFTKATEGKARLKDLQGNPAYKNVRRKS
jgi:hypothetical protein